MDTPHWPQFPGGGGGVTVKQMEAGGGGGGSSSTSSSKGNNLLERKARPQKEQALNCPRCNSTNTKFCYYNNYSLSQPRYFCKACRRYWTEGGSLRNVPVGGGSRKNRRSSSSSSSLSSSSSVADKKINGSDQNPKIIIHHAHDQDLNLAIFPPNTNHGHPIASPSTTTSHLLSSFMAAPPNGGGGGGGFGLHEMKPSLSFSLEGFPSGGGYGDQHLHHHHHHHQDQTAVMFPIGDLKQSNGAAEFEQIREEGHSGGGYWNGMLGGGSW